jgi:FKBP-type peptidyl-prolyl cis-trans isomerase SlyD
MIISKGTVVSIDYVLKDDEGNLVDQSDEARPLVYLQGFGNIIPGLEQALEGRETGDSVQVRVAPEQGYGLSRPEMVQVVPKDRFEGMEGEVEAGMQFHARTQEGGVITVRVVKVEDSEVTIDGNHPLADQHLNFDVNVKEIRLATVEELEHGHPHVEGGGCCGGGNCDSPDKQDGDSCDHSGGCGCQH